MVAGGGGGGGGGNGGCGGGVGGGGSGSSDYGDSDGWSLVARALSLHFAVQWKRTRRAVCIGRPQHE